MQAPALHIDPKSRFGPCDEARAVAAIAVAARGIEVPMPILFGRRNLGYVVGQRNSPYVWKSDPVPMQAAGFPNRATVVSQIQSGFGWQQIFAKTVGASSSQWIDAWSATGDPVAGSYTGAAFTAVQFTDATPGALSHGGNASPSFKFVSHIAGSSTAGAGQALILYDRVLTYESCTFNAATLQSMTNTLPALRYNGPGLPGLQISMTAQAVNGATVTLLSQLAYTDQAGTAAQALPATTPNIGFLASAAAASTSGAVCICPCDTGNAHTQPFLYLAPQDTGVQKIESYTTTVTNTGTFAFVLSRPLAYMMMPASGSRFQIDLLDNVLGLERIYDGACLSFFIYGGQTSQGPTITGRIETVWG